MNGINRTQVRTSTVLNTALPWSLFLPCSKELKGEHDFWTMPAGNCFRVAQWGTDLGGLSEEKQTLPRWAQTSFPAKENHCSEWIFKLEQKSPCVALSFWDTLTVGALTDKRIYFIVCLSNNTRKEQFFYEALSLRSFQSKLLCEVSRWGLKSK